ncbi:MAG: class II aldolase/adducin family protein [Mailhella sp.]|nr:class II aldolase/adducin family protein [Mailhella sp.]
MRRLSKNGQRGRKTRTSQDGGADLNHEISCVLQGQCRTGRKGKGWKTCESPQAYHPQSSSEAIAILVLANHILANEHFLDGFGHVSIRDPEQPGNFFLSRSLAPELVTADDILRLTLEGDVVGEDTRRPYLEKFIHAEVYRARPDVQAVIHGHPLSVIAMSAINVPVVPVFHMAGALGSGVPVFDAYDPENGTLTRTSEEGRRLADCLGQHTALLMRNHGAVIAAGNMAEAVMTALALRDNCTIQMQCLSAGVAPSALSPALARAAAALNFSQNPLFRAWNYWISRLPQPQ